MLKVVPPLRVAVLCSHRAPGLLHLLERRPDRGAVYEIVAVVTSELAFDEQRRVAAHGVPVRAHAIHEFYRRRDADLYRDFRVRAEYDRETVARLAPFAPDLVLLDGYLYLATRELLDAYPARILNLHFSDLTLRQADGRPLYPGIRAVRDAVADGRSATKATVHLVNLEPDGGAPLVESWPFPVSPLAGDARAWGARDMLKAYAFAHQEWMMRAASGPLVAAAFRLIAGGAVDLNALVAANPADVLPRTVDRHGHITYRHAA
jgi:folate-dependent phosphoribosylglycinamide formyltransferase PurN